jgi:hypothetical protein
VDLTRQHKNRFAGLVEGVEIEIRPVRGYPISL